MCMPKVVTMSAYWYKGLRRWGAMSVCNPWSWRGCSSVMRCTMEDPLFTLHQLSQSTVMTRRRWRRCPRGAIYRLPWTSRA